MKKLAIGSVVVIALLAGIIVVNYGWISPANDITGCYVAKVSTLEDTLCLAGTGAYVQHYRLTDSLEETYNNSTWLQFSYKTDGTKFKAATLKDFVIIDAQGKPIKTQTLDVQPHKNTFGKTTFAIGSNYAGKRRIYTKQ